jgi:undecaprenyl pyrophosphate phosphatase UppP
LVLGQTGADDIQAIERGFGIDAFLLALPTEARVGDGDFEVLGVGLVTAFASAFLCIRWLLRYIASHDFTVFAWYRIAFGVIVLLTAYTGLVEWTQT